ncbi:MAG: hypothetical protein LBU39_06265 [Desulfobulbaceae bacterium]|nr:hypothetical protein [Desulfobulbaceae bacterium]
MPAQTDIQAGYCKCNSMDCRWRGDDGEESAAMTEENAVYSRHARADGHPGRIWQMRRPGLPLAHAAMTHANDMQMKCSSAFSTTPVYPQASAQTSPYLRNTLFRKHEIFPLSTAKNSYISEMNAIETVTSRKQGQSIEIRISNKHL